MYCSRSSPAFVSGIGASRLAVSSVPGTKSSICLARNCSASIVHPCGALALVSRGSASRALNSRGRASRADCGEGFSQSAPTSSLPRRKFSTFFARARGTGTRSRYIVRAKMNRMNGSIELAFHLPLLTVDWPIRGRGRVSFSRSRYQYWIDTIRSCRHNCDGKSARSHPVMLTSSAFRFPAAGAAAAVSANYAIFTSIASFTASTSTVRVKVAALTALSINASA